MEEQNQLSGFTLRTKEEQKDIYFKEHKHTYFEILLIMKGKRFVKINGEEFLAKDGDIIIFFPGEVHEEKTLSKTISYLVLNFGDYNLQQLHVDFPKLPPAFHVFNIGADSGIFEVLNKIIREDRGNLEDAAALKGAYFIEFVVLLKRAFREALKGLKTNSPGRERITSAITLMKKSFDKDMNLSELAGQSFLSASYFSQVFKEKTGKSPKQYLIKEKIEKAKELLSKTDKSIKQIADELGYETESYFFRQFKHKTRLTPMDFRERKKV